MLLSMIIKNEINKKKEASGLLSKLGIRISLT